MNLNRLKNIPNEEERAEESIGQRIKKEDLQDFPFEFKHEPKIFAPIEVGPKLEGEDFEEKNIDRGFFLSEDEFVDSYTAATTSELPEEAMTTYV